MRRKLGRKIFCWLLIGIMLYTNFGEVVLAGQQLGRELPVNDDFMISPIEQRDNKVRFSVQEKLSLQEKGFFIEKIYITVSEKQEEEIKAAYLLGTDTDGGYYFEVETDQIIGKDQKNLFMQPIIIYDELDNKIEENLQGSNCVEVDSEKMETGNRIELEGISIEIPQEEDIEKEEQETAPETEDDRNLNSDININVPKDEKQEEQLETKNDEEQELSQEETDELIKIESKVIAEDVDGSQRQYKITVKADIYDELRVAVWSETNGQDDIVWYPTVRDENVYTTLIDIKNHRSVGTYIAHIYGKNTGGNPIYVAGTRFSIDAPTKGKMTVNDTENGFQVEVKNVSSPSGIKSMRAAIWSKPDQSDLVWLDAKKKNSEIYVLDVNTNNLVMQSGTYKIHFYCIDGNGFQNFCGSILKDVVVENNKLTVTNPDQQQKKYTISLNTTEFSNVRFAIWSGVDGQDDLKWYTGNKQGNLYSVELEISRHGAIGTYYIDVYGDKNKECTYINGTTIKIDAPVAENFTTNRTQTGFQVKFDNVFSLSGIKMVEAAVWSKKDQSDLRWSNVKSQNGKYIVDVNIAEHKMNIGEYKVHIYVTDGNGIKSFCGGVKYTVDIKAQKIDVSSNESGCTISILGVETTAPYKNVSVAVWGKRNSQDDVRWYTAQKNGNDYVVSISNDQLIENGEYLTHIYIKDSLGNAVFLGGKEFKLNRTTVLSLGVAGIDGTKGIARLVAEVKNPGYVIEKVHVGVWNKISGGTVWYDMERSAAGSYSTDIDVKNHNYRFGEYSAHAYFKDKDGVEHFIDGETINIIPSNIVRFEKTEKYIGKVTIYGPNVSGTSVTDVRVATWSEENGQDDMVWQNAVKGDNYEYSAQVKRYQYKSGGEYVSHVYGYINGKAHFLGGVRYIMPSIQEFDAYAQMVMHNIIFAVETGGQIYGRAKYDCFAPAYNLTPKETAITIGAAGWFATEAQKLLRLIREEDPLMFAMMDTQGIGKDVDTENWTYYGGDRKGHATILRGSPKAVCIQKLISTKAGIAVQNRLVDEQMVKYVNEARNLGVMDLKASMFCANIRHLGGYGAMKRVIEWCKEDGRDFTMTNIYNSMREHTTNKDGNGVGADRYNTRHKKVMSWLNSYIG